MADAPLDLAAGLPVTPEDIAALNRLRAKVPSWLWLDWRTLDALVPADTLARRPIASDTWQPFTLDSQPAAIDR